MYFFSPFGRDATPSQATSPQFVRFLQWLAGTHLYSWVERGTVRVKYPAQKYDTVSLARVRTRATWSGDECTRPPRLQGFTVWLNENVINLGKNIITRETKWNIVYSDISSIIVQQLKSFQVSSKTTHRHVRPRPETLNSLCNFKVATSFQFPQSIEYVDITVAVERSVHHALFLLLVHPIMVMEYLVCGDLLGYLRKSRGVHDKYHLGQGSVSKLEIYDLVLFSKQIAAGMVYLGSHGVSIAISQNLHCNKIAFAKTPTLITALLHLNFMSLFNKL